MGKEHKAKIKILEQKINDVERECYNQIVLALRKGRIDPEGAKNGLLGNAYNVLGNIYQNEEKYDEAENYFKEAINVDPSHKWIYEHNLKIMRGGSKKMLMA